MALKVSALIVIDRFQQFRNRKLIDDLTFVFLGDDDVQFTVGDHLLCEASQVVRAEE